MQARAYFVMALIGIGHFVLSLIAWGNFYVGAYRNEWRTALTLGYGVRHFAPAVLLFVLFVWASAAAWRRRRSVRWVLALGLLLCLILLLVDVRGDPQFYRVWFDHADSCSNRQSFYCTWWWWQPTRH
jgi:hypothetical protein